MEPIQAGVGALEARPWRQIAAYRDELGGYDLRLALDLCISEAVEGESRLELDLFFTCQGVGVGRLRRSQRMGVQRSARRQDLGVTHPDLVARTTADRQAHESCDVPTRIEGDGAVGPLGDLGVQGRNAAHRRRDPRPGSRPGRMG